MNIESIETAVNMGNEESKHNAEAAEGIGECRHVLRSLGLSPEEIQELAGQSEEKKAHMFH